MAALRRKRWVSFAAALLVPLSAQAQIPSQPAPQIPESPPQIQIEPVQVDNLKDLFARLRSCWRPPPASRAIQEMSITVVVSFDRSGNIFGHPKITYESEQASDNDRISYRVAVMETLQRCTPMPFTDSMGGAAAGRPFTIQFSTRKTPPKPTEKRAWLTSKIL